MKKCKSMTVLGLVVFTLLATSGFSHAIRLTPKDNCLQPDKTTMTAVGAENDPSPVKTATEMASTSIAAPEKTSGGKIYMVSMGVGDPDLITVRAIKAIEKSDIIICRPGFRKTFARYLDNKTFWDGAFDQWRTYGRQCSRLENRQEQQKCLEDKKIRQKLTAKIRAAIKEGKIISVLGSGDLFIYGGPYRWYRQELEDIDIETIPGVSSLNAANAVIGKDIMAGDPVHSAVLTHYHGIDKLAHHRPTMIIFTMHTKFSDIVEKLKSYYPPQTPIAVVFYAGYKDRQYQIKGNLNNIINKTEKIDFPFEHLVYVGGFMK